MKRKTKINIQLFGEEPPIIKKVEDLDDDKEKDKETEQPKPQEKSIESLEKEIAELKDKILKLEANEKELLKENNKLFNKCLSYKENKSESETNDFYKKFI